MKKEKSPVLVILCIVFLSLFIILPPTFRAIIPRTIVEDNNDSSSNPKLVIINCNKIYPNELYQVNSKTKFVNNTSTNIITYQKLETLPDNYVSSTVSDVDETNATTEIAYFKNLVEIKMKENENMVRFTIDNNLINNNQTDTTLVNYLAASPDMQKTNYENLGYTCNRMES